jgi:hypothetical protein
VNSEKKVEKNSEFFEYFLYWIIVCFTGLIDSYINWIPGVHTLRVLFLAAMLNPKINLKHQLHELLFAGKGPLFNDIVNFVGEQYRNFIVSYKKSV